MQISSKQFIAFIVILLFFLFFIGASIIDAPPAEQQISEEEAVCPWCGKTHGSSAMDRLVRRFHWLLDSPARLFERLSQSPGRMLSPRLREQSAYAPREYGYINIIINKSFNFLQSIQDCKCGSRVIFF